MKKTNEKQPDNWLYLIKRRGEKEKIKISREGGNAS